MISFFHQQHTVLSNTLYNSEMPSFRVKETTKVEVAQGRKFRNLLDLK